jgi:hypothetical protein
MQLKRILSAWTIALVFVGGVLATTVIPPTFEELSDRAEIVFVGKAVASRTEWRTISADRVIFTLVEFEVAEIWKGSAGKSLTLQFLGGTVGDATMEVAGVPRFSTDDRVVLFVEKNGVQFCPLVGIFHGKFALRKDEKTGRDIVLRHDGKPLRDVSEIGNGEGAEFSPNRAQKSIPADREPMLVDDFKTQVRQQLSKRTAHK